MSATNAKRGFWIVQGMTRRPVFFFRWTANRSGELIVDRRLFVVFGSRVGLTGLPCVSS
jgi:hypothetical protein